MGVEQVPIQYRWTCDRCTTTAVSKELLRPVAWSELEFKALAYDTMGAPAGDNSLKKCFCPRCSDAIRMAIDPPIAMKAKTVAEKAGY